MKTNIRPFKEDPAAKDYCGPLQLAKYYRDVPGSVRIMVKKFTSPIYSEMDSEEVVQGDHQFRLKEAQDYVENMVTGAIREFGPLQEEFFKNRDTIHFEFAKQFMDVSTIAQTKEWYEANPNGTIHVALIHRISLGFGSIPVSGEFEVMVIKNKNPQSH